MLSIPQYNSLGLVLFSEIGPLACTLLAGPPLALLFGERFSLECVVVGPTDWDLPEKSHQAQEVSITNQFVIQTRQLHLLTVYKLLYKTILETSTQLRKG